ncbi:EthD family reductase [Bacillus sp. B15-48]|uniref:EthD family reductase n=1 Tax=Bacillus sp. B15-48 TaxID=1548601 RepID=UPI00193F26DA|nr:EthD family reductase [Bacillus sp. B15-48]MBM4763338.1 EthD family reductase [Bacillus sp. B15-48]
MAAKILVYYRKTDQQEEFEDYYFNVHLPIVRKISQIKDLKIARVVHSNDTVDDLYLHGEILFENMETLKEAIESPEGQAMFEDAKKMRKFFKNPPITTFVEFVD